MKIRTLFLLGLLCIPSIFSLNARVQLGIDVLEQHNFSALAGKRIGLITNQTGVDSSGVRTREVLFRARNVKLVALFAPEHGLDGTELAGKYVANRKDPLTGLTVYSLYGPNRKPTPEMLHGIDVLVYDMQDIGVRSYTYVSTMGRCMEAAGENNIEFMVLDRPNPLGGIRVEGPMIEQRWISFVGQFPVPYVHGMTVGELARMVNSKRWMATTCNLKVVRMEGWRREMVWAETGLRWYRTSPNIPRDTSPLYYIVTGIIGSLSGVDTGVGESRPFEYLTAPWMDGENLARRLHRMDLSGVQLTPLRHGVSFQIHPKAGANLTALAIHLLAEVNRDARPDMFARTSASKLDIFYKVYGSDSIRRQLTRGESPERIVAAWQRDVERFRRERQSFLLY